MMSEKRLARKIRTKMSRQCPPAASFRSQLAVAPAAVSSDDVGLIHTKKEIIILSHHHHHHHPLDVWHAGRVSADKGGGREDSQPR